ncbi:MAG: hypothetical protein U0575_04220 [Phycisphaerales bacterium]
MSREGERLPVADVLHRLDASLRADLGVDQALEPVERVDDDGLELVLLGVELAERGEDVAIPRGQREAGHVDVGEAVLRLDEDRLFGARCERGLADAVDAVDEDATRCGNSAARYLCDNPCDSVGWWFRCGRSGEATRSAWARGRCDGTARLVHSLLVLARAPDRARARDAPHAGAVGLALLDGDSVDGKLDAPRLREERAVEGELVRVAEGEQVALEPVELLAGLQVDDAAPAVGVDPVDAALAAMPAVLAAHDALRNAVGEKLGRNGMRPHARGHLADGRGLPVVDRGLAEALGPLGECLRCAAERLAGLRVDRSADGELGLEALAPFEDEHMRGTPDGERLTVALGDETELAPAIERRAAPELAQRVRREELARAGVIHVGGLADERAKVDRGCGCGRHAQVRWMDVTGEVALAEAHERRV